MNEYNLKYIRRRLKSFVISDKMPEEFEHEEYGGKKMEYRILPRSEVEDMVRNFIIDNNIYAKYGKDSEGLFQVNFVVEEEKEDD